VVILMTMSETVSLADARTHLSELVGRVAREHDRVTVTVHGRPSAVLLSPDDLEALEKTIAVLSDHAAVEQLPHDPGTALGNGRHPVARSGG
jgi:prevent-host-death family protein